MADGGGGPDRGEVQDQGLISGDDIPEVEAKDGESVLETAEKALKAIKDKGARRKGKKAEQAEEEETFLEAKPEEGDQQSDKDTEKKPIDEELLPPEGLLSSEKEEFLKMKYGPRRAFNRMWKRGVSEIQERFRQISAKEREHQGIYDAVYPYRDSIPEGHTVPSMLGALMKVHHNIAQADENKAFSEVVGIAERRFGTERLKGLLQGYLSGEQNFSKNIEQPFRQSSDPALLERLDRIERFHSEQAAAPIAREFEAVANERDRFGNFVYPELQNPDFVSWLNDKVVQVKLENPSLSWGDSMREAWSRATGRQVPVSAKPTTTSHQANSGNTSRALSAAATTRGRTTSEVVDDDELPEWATKSVEATAQWALQQERKRLRM